MTHILSALLLPGDTACFRDGRELVVEDVHDSGRDARAFVRNRPDSISGSSTVQLRSMTAMFLEVPFADAWIYARGNMGFSDLVSGNSSEHDIVAIAKTSEDNSANARIIFAKDLVPEQFRDIQSEAMKFLSPSTAFPASVPDVVSWGVESFTRYSELDRMVEAVRGSEEERRISRSFTGGGSGGANTYTGPYRPSTSWYTPMPRGSIGRR